MGYLTEGNAAVAIITKIEVENGDVNPCYYDDHKYKYCLIQYFVVMFMPKG